MSRKNQDKVIAPSHAAKLLAIAYPDLPRLDRPWTRRDVYALRKQKPGWLTSARGRLAAVQREQAEQRRLEEQRRLARLPKADCLCCGAEFAFEPETGGLCENCNEGYCAECGSDDEDWLYG